MSQGLIASSILMAWYSPNPTEYVAISKARLPTQFLQPYTADNQAPLVAVQGLHSAVNEPRDEGSLDSPPQPMRQGQRLLESAAASIRSLCKCKLDSELESAARELLIFLQNVRHRTWQHLSLEDQLSTMFPIRNWLRFVPRSPDRFLSNDFLLYLYMANYETAMLAMGTVLPAVHLPLAMTQRSSGVARLRIFIQDAVNARFSGAESIANSLPVYTACMEWLALADECVESYQTRGAPLKRDSLCR
ncbi:hypothetical protein MANI_119611 [Metarhizium anisopliae]